MPRLEANEPLTNKPVWDGPCSDSDSGGITNSLLSRFLVCRERFRLMVVEGLKPQDDFNHKIRYGDMWHVCEESYAKDQNFLKALTDFSGTLMKKYPTRSTKIAHWANVCMIQFPIYLDHWDRSSEERGIEVIQLAQEQVYKVPYKLPSGRVVYLRGKLDAIQRALKGLDSGIYLFENKTKGTVDQRKIARQMRMDLQTMLYLVALEEIVGSIEDGYQKRDIKGVRYNVIKRPLSSGKGCIRQHKPTKSNPRGESSEAFYRRLGKLITEEPKEYFYRWTIYISEGDIRRFKERCLNPLLENLCDWWEWIGRVSNPFHQYQEGAVAGGAIHWQTPYFYNPLLEGGSTDLDECLETGSRIGLTQTDNLFPELSEG